MDDARTRRAAAIALAAFAIVGLAVRLWVMTRSAGSNDIVLWKGFADNIRRFGIVWTYDNVRIFNHPPLPGYFAYAVYALSLSAPVRFEFAFKLLPLLGDVLSGALLVLIWRRQGAAAAARAVAFLALSLVSILVTAHHGNTDPLVVALVLLSAYLFDRGRTLAAGLALGAALNVKLIPGVLLPLYFLRCRSWRDVERLLAGLVPWTLPFVPVLIRVGKAFARNAIAYNSNPHRWGLNALLEFASGTDRVKQLGATLYPLFREHGRYPMIAAIMAIAGVAQWRDRWSMVELATLGMICFLVFAPGFGPQYAVYAAPMLLAVDLRRGLAYSCAAGLFVLILYAETWTGERPWYSHFVTHFSYAGVVVGMVAWTLLVEAGVTILARRRAQET